MKPLTDDELVEALPSRRMPELQRAIGRSLLDVRRLFVLDPPRFRRAFPGATDKDYFGRNTGPVEFLFDGGIAHRLALWDEQLSLVLIDHALEDTEAARLVSLRETPLAPARLKSCLGRRCSDVRIWVFRENVASTEAREAGVSYVLEGEELIYCFYLHGDDDNDYLLFRDEISPDRVASCFSLAEQRPIIVS